MKIFIFIFIIMIMIIIIMRVTCERVDRARMLASRITAMIHGSCSAYTTAATWWLIS